MVQHLHVHVHGPDEVLECAPGGMANAKSDNEKQAESLELGMCLAECSWNVHGLVVHDLMDLSQVSQSRE
jgi:hypothetical protein